MQNFKIALQALLVRIVFMISCLNAITLNFLGLTEYFSFIHWWIVFNSNVVLLLLHNRTITTHMHTVGWHLLHS